MSIDKQFFNCMIGRHFPFFLTNGPLNSQYFLYAIDSPKLSREYYPLITFRKINEKTKYGTPCFGNEVLNLFTRQDVNIKIGKKYLSVLKDILRKDEPYMEKNGKGFPLIEYTGNVNMYRTIITGIRGLLREHMYKFCPGRTVDILCGRDTFIVCKIKGSDSKIFLQPEALYDVKDVNLQYPKPVPDGFKFPEGVYNITSESGWKINSELETAIRRIEWGSINL